MRRAEAVTRCRCIVIPSSAERNPSRAASRALVGRKLALVFAGGPDRTVVSERQLLDLERDAFLSLCGEPKTLERIAYTLKTGKPLRN